MAALLSVACDPVDDVRVQPLPSLARSSPEARAGLPEVAGAWRFAGWELAPDDSASLERGLPALGALQVQAQRMDSVAGFYQAGEARLPVVGEVRRDSVVALVALSAPGQGYFLAGRISRDTLWMGLTSLLEPGAWPRAARAAFVRGPVATPFVRLHGASPPAPLADSALTGALAAGSDTAAASRALDSVAPVPAPAQTAPTTTPPVAPARPAAQPAPSPAARPTAPAESARDARRPPPAAPRPEVQPPRDTPQRVVPRDTPQRRLPPLLGDPIRRDTARDTIR